MDQDFGGTKGRVGGRGGSGIEGGGEDEARDA
jgi:hypothetical protein